jgi:K+-sensing histidine kinase KdpD
MNGFLDRHRGAVLVAAVLVPVAAAALLAVFRGSLENTNVALVLVLVVVAAASTGFRAAALLAALASAVSFDFFLTAPFHTLRITDSADVETAVLLVAVGVAVTEVALWGRRQQGAASRQQGYLSGVLETVGSVAGGVPPAELTDRVGAQIRELLSLDSCVFESDLTAPQFAQLTPDGTILRAGNPVDVVRSGLPTDTEIELLVRSAGAVQGRYLLTSATGVRRPTLEQRQVAVALADQVGAALTVTSGTR